MEGNSILSNCLEHLSDDLVYSHYIKSQVAQIKDWLDRYSNTWTFKDDGSEGIFLHSYIGRDRNIQIKYCSKLQYVIFDNKVYLKACSEYPIILHDVMEETLPDFINIISKDITFICFNCHPFLHYKNFKIIHEQGIF